MTGLRIVTAKGMVPMTPCIRCKADGCPWDRIADKPICPDCQEKIALGEGPPLAEHLNHDYACAICAKTGTVRYLTYPLNQQEPLEIDLCGAHLQALLYRRLDCETFQHLSERLQDIGVHAEHIFLLHNAFYDLHGQPLQPVADAW